MRRCVFLSLGSTAFQSVEIVVSASARAGSVKSVRCYDHVCLTGWLAINKIHYFADLVGFCAVLEISFSTVYVKYGRFLADENRIARSLVSPRTARILTL